MVNQSQKCGRCNRTVYFAEKKVAIKKVWHTFCFSCAICHKLLDSCTLNTYQGELYCSVCYQNVSSYDVSDVEDGDTKKREIKPPKTQFTEPVDDQTSWIVCQTTEPKVDPISIEKKGKNLPEEETEVQIMFKSAKDKPDAKKVTIENPKKTKDHHPFGLGFFSSKKSKGDKNSSKPERPDKTLEKTQTELYETPIKTPTVEKNKKSGKHSRNKKNTRLDESEDVFSTPAKQEVQEIDEMIQVPSRNDHKGCGDPRKCSKLCGPDRLYKEKPSNRSKKPKKISSMEVLASDTSDASEKNVILSKKDAKKNFKEPKAPTRSKSPPQKKVKNKNSALNEEESTQKKQICVKSTKKPLPSSDDTLQADSSDFFKGTPVSSTPKKIPQSEESSLVEPEVKGKDKGASGRESPTKRQKKTALGIKKKTSSTNTVASSNGTVKKEKRSKKKNGRGKKNRPDSNISPRDSFMENYSVKIQERIQFMESLIDKVDPYDEKDENICTNKTNFKHCSDMHKNCSCHTKCENKCDCSSMFCKKLNEARQAEDGGSNPCQQDHCFVKTPRQVSGYYSRRNISDPLCESCFPKCKRLSPDICRRCNNKVYVVEKMCAAGGVFHDCCFTCFICQRHLDSLKLVARRGEIFCKQCYLKYFGPHVYGYNMSPNIN